MPVLKRLIKTIPNLNIISKNKKTVRCREIEYKKNK